MADTKISGLPASTTPLAGTEELPIVQSGITRKVSVANLTAGRPLSATQMTLTTGNLIVASGQGIDFSATPGTGTSELFADYEEGTWTPIIGGWIVVGAATLTGTYTRVGRLITFFAFVSHATSTQSVAGSSYITGLPFTPVADSSCLASSNATDVGYGTGSVSGSNTTDQVYPPSVTLGANQVMVVTGTYYV